MKIEAQKSGTFQEFWKRTRLAIFGKRDRSCVGTFEQEHLTPQPEEKVFAEETPPANSIVLTTTQRE